MRLPGFGVMVLLAAHANMVLAQLLPNFPGVPPRSQAYAAVTMQAFNRYAAELLRETYSNSAPSIPGDGEPVSIDQIYEIYGEERPSSQDYEEMVSEIIDEIVFIDPDNDVLMWHPDAALVPPQVRVLGQLEQALVSALKTENYHQTRVLMGKAFRLVQGRHFQNESTTEAEHTAALNGTLDFLRNLKSQVGDNTKIVKFLSVSRARDLVLVLRAPADGENNTVVAALRDRLTKIIASPVIRDQPRRIVLVTFNQNGHSLKAVSSSLTAIVNLLNQPDTLCDECSSTGGQIDLQTALSDAILLASDTANRRSTIFVLTQFGMGNLPVRELTSRLLANRQRLVAIISGQPLTISTRNLRATADATGGDLIRVPASEYTNAVHVLTEGPRRDLVTLPVTANGTNRVQFQVDSDVEDLTMYGSSDDKASPMASYTIFDPAGVPQEASVLLSATGVRHVRLPNGTSGMWTVEYSGSAKFIVQGHSNADVRFRLFTTAWAGTHYVSKKVHANPLVGDSTYLVVNSLCNSCDPSRIQLTYNFTSMRDVQPLSEALPQVFFVEIPKVPVQVHLHARSSSGEVIQRVAPPLILSSIFRPYVSPFGHQPSELVVPGATTQRLIVHVQVEKETDNATYHLSAKDSKGFMEPFSETGTTDVPPSYSTWITPPPGTTPGETTQFSLIISQSDSLWEKEYSGNYLYSQISVVDGPLSSDMTCEAVTETYSSECTGDRSTRPECGQHFWNGEIKVTDAYDWFLSGSVTAMGGQEYYDRPGEFSLDRLSFGISPENVSISTTVSVNETCCVTRYMLQLPQSQKCEVGKKAASPPASSGNGSDGTRNRISCAMVGSVVFFLFVIGNA